MTTRITPEIPGTVYCAGPMRGLPEFNYPAFFAAADEMRSRGLKVLNPAENDADTSKPVEYFLALAIPQVIACDTVVLLPGWRNSKGVALELHIAHSLGKQVLEYETMLPPKVELAIERAARITAGERNKNYGDAFDNFSRTALIWSGILGFSVTAKQVGLCQVGVKLAREGNCYLKDNYDDGIGYLHLVDKDPRFHEAD